MQTVSVKFYGKNVNEGMFAPLNYIGSMSFEVDYLSRAILIASAESIGGPIDGPLVAMVEGEIDIRVLKV